MMFPDHYLEPIMPSFADIVGSVFPSDSGVVIVLNSGRIIWVGLRRRPRVGTPLTYVLSKYVSIAVRNQT